MRHIVLILLLITSTGAHAQWESYDAQGHTIQIGPQYAWKGDFGTHQISTTDPEQLHKSWAQLTPGVDVSTQDEATRNQPIFSFVIFRGCKAGPDGNCHVTARFAIIAPDGKPYGDPNEAPVWSFPPPPAGNLQLGQGASGLRVEDGELLGKYRVIAQTTDQVANITLTTEQTLNIKETPMVGGWMGVSNPDGDAEIRGAAAAILGHLPVNNAKLLLVEKAQRQVVAGTNIRLILRLVDGSKWSALVWHKPDGSFAVDSPSQVK